MPDDGPGLFTIGHSNQALDHFLSLLQRHGIEAVADVRTVPWSRYVPHFNAKALGAALASQGIGYVPLGAELGGRPAGDEFYDEQDHVLYGRLAAGAAFQDGLDQVLARARTSRIALLCSEEDPARCHRHLLIGRVLRERGVGLTHIRRDGRMETEAQLAAREAGGIATAPTASNAPQALPFDDGRGGDGSGGGGGGDDGGGGDGGDGDQPWRSPGPVPRTRRPPSRPAG